MGRDDWDDWEDEEARPAPPPPRRASMFTEPIDPTEEAAPESEASTEPPEEPHEPSPAPDPETPVRPARGEETPAERTAQLFDDGLPAGYSPYQEGLGDGPQRLDYDFVDQPDDEPLPVAWTGVMRPIKDEPATGRPRWASRRREAPDAPTSAADQAAAAATTPPPAAAAPEPARGWTGAERESTTTVPRSQPTQGSLQRGWIYLPVAVAVGILIGVGGFLGVQKFWGGSDAAPTPSPTASASASPEPTVVAEPAPTPEWPEVNPTPLAGVELGSRNEPQSVPEPGSYTDTDEIWGLAGPGWGLNVWRNPDGSQQNLYLVSPESERFLLARLRTDIDISVQHWDPATAQSWLQRRYSDGTTQTIRFDLRAGRSTEDWVEGFDTVDAVYLTTLRDGRDLWVTLSSVTAATAVVAYDPVADSAAVLPGLEDALEIGGAIDEVEVAVQPDPGRRSIVVRQRVKTAADASAMSTTTWLHYDLTGDSPVEFAPPEVAGCDFELAIIDDGFLMSCAGELRLVDAQGETIRAVAEIERPNPVAWQEVFTDTPDDTGDWGEGVVYSRR